MNIRGLMAALAAVATVASFGAINSRSYVQGGLVAQYDGIDNAGFGQHSSDASTWVDLTGHGNNATKAANVTWTANGWQNSAACYPMSVGGGLAPVTATKTFTAEFACTPSRRDTRECFFSQYNQRGYCIEHNSSGGKRTGGFVRMYLNATPARDWNAHDIKILADEWASISFSSTPFEQTFCKNGTYRQYAYFDATANGVMSSTCPSVIGGDPERTDKAFYGTYNTFRLYDRVLTAEEVKINAAVDAVRFNNASWSDYPELACYTFASDGTLQQNIMAVAGEGGSVRVGAGEAVASATAATANFGGEMTATLTAVPDSGYVFYRWEGANGIITSGTEISTTITVVANKGVNLRAVFILPTSGVTSRSYVQSGLVAQYDGINNAGHDAAHNPSAATWADLTGNGNDGTCASELSWDDYGWSVDANCKPVTLGNGISAVTATGVYTLQFACMPTRTGSRECFFSQYIASVKGIGIEHNSGDVSDGRLRFYSNAYGTSAWGRAGTGIVVANEWASVAVTSANAGKNIVFWKCGANVGGGTFDGSKTHEANCTSIIGGEPNTGRDMAFRGTYNAFRVYNRVLTEREQIYNAAIDAIRFNGGANMPAGYAKSADNKLQVILSATATQGGKVRVCGGEAAASVSEAVNQDGSQFAYLEAIPEAGYVFQGWIGGDASTIIEGTSLDSRIAVDTTVPVALQAQFGSGSALDGMILDLDIHDVEDGAIPSSDERTVGNDLKAGASGSEFSRAYTCWYTPVTSVGGVEEYRPTFKIKDIQLPAAPTATNAAQPCIYLPQHYEEVAGTSKCAAVRWELPYNQVRGPVATIFVRFLWEGNVYPKTDKYNDCCILCNGYTDYDKTGRGFVLRMRSSSNTNKAYFNVFTPGAVPSPDMTAEATLGTYIESGRWVDCFVSFYPSPTDSRLSNADVWFCQASSPKTSNGTTYFDKPELKHKHFGDEAGLSKFKTIDEDHAMRVGSESSGASTDVDDIRKTFRGYYGALKAWNRLLTENEMWSVMLGQYGGTFNLGVENGSADEFGAVGRTVETFNAATNKWLAMKKSLTSADRTLTIEVPLTADNAGLPRMLEILPLFDGVGATCPVTVTAGGATVGTFDLMKADERTILIRRDYIKRNANGNLVITVTRPEGCAGTLSFDALSLSGSWQVGADNGTSTDMGAEGNTTPKVYVMGDSDYKHAELGITTTSPHLSLLFDVSTSSAGKTAYRYQTKVTYLGGKNTYPMHIELNGDTIWSANNLTTGQIIKFDIPAEDIKPGLNELKLHLDANTSGNTVCFDYHKMKMVPPPLGTVVTVK